MLQKMTSWFSLLFFVTTIHANSASSFPEKIFIYNEQHINRGDVDFESLAKSQTPIATVLACADSRIQTEAFYERPIGNIFMVRNIGNQLANSSGSIEYGIRHLKTPILLILGHSGCGAIQAAKGDYSKESRAIRDELNALHLKNKHSTQESVVQNVHYQVSRAYIHYKDLVEQEKLVILGMLYDIHNHYNDVSGSLLLININTEQDINVLKKHELLKNIKNIKIGID